MVDPGTLLTLAVALLASGVMAWVIGAGSSGATPFAAAVGANAISILRAALLVGVLVFLGAALQGGSVSRAVGTELVGGVALPPVGVIAALVIGAGLMLVGIFTGYPIATAFTVTGAIVGVGLALGGTPAWGKYTEIVALWVLTPPLGGGVAYALASTLPREGVPESTSVPLLAGLVGAVVANVRFSLLGGIAGTSGPASSIAAAFSARVGLDPLAGRAAVTLGIAGLVILLLRWAIGRDQPAAIRRFLVVLGGLVAFSAGGSQVGLAVGPLLPLLSDFAVPVTAVLVAGGLGMLVGAWTGAPRMIKALSQDYASLGPRRAISALVPSFVIAQVAILLGVPVSFNEIVVSAIVGSGFAVGGFGSTSPAKLGRTVLAWIGSFVLSFVLGYGLIVLLAPP
ncbi:MAG: inorganic phosphate transporter [Haloarculaceae archaeon]